MNNYSSTISKIITTIIIAVTFSFNAFALNLQQAKAQGIVGETETGYIEAIKDTKAAQALVKQVNGKRKQIYLKMAKKNKVQLSQIEQLAGEKAIKKTRAGHLIKQNGQWVKK